MPFGPLAVDMEKVKQSFTDKPKEVTSTGNRSPLASTAYAFSPVGLPAKQEMSKRFPQITLDTEKLYANTIKEKTGLVGQELIDEVSAYVNYKHPLPQKIGEKRRGIFGSAVSALGKQIVGAASDIGERGKNIGSIVKENVLNEGDVNPFVAGAMTVREGVGAASDILYRAIQPLFSGAKGFAKGFAGVDESTFQRDIQRVLGTPGAQEGLGKLAEGIDAYNQWVENNPNIGNLTNSLIGTLLDASDFAGLDIALKGGKLVAEQASKKGVTEALRKGANKLVGGAMSPLDKSGRALDEFVKDSLGKFAGFERETVDTIVENKQLFRDAMEGKISFEDQRDKILTRIADAEEQLSEVGRGYDKIRDMGDVKVDFSKIKSMADDVLTDRKAGIKILDDGTLDFSKSTIQTVADQSAIQKMYDQITSRGLEDINSSLNARGSLDNIFRESTKDKKVKSIMTELRGAIDKVVKKEVPGLSELDAIYGPQRQLLNSIKDDFFKKSGDPRSGQLSTVINLLNKSNADKLKRLEQISPGITDDIKQLAAVEDIARSKSSKRGTYAQAVMLGIGGLTAVGGFAAGNEGLGKIGLAAAILSYPPVTISVLRKYGKLSSTVKKIRKGIALTDAELSKIDEIISPADRKSLADNIRNASDTNNRFDNESIANAIVPDSIVGTTNKFNKLDETSFSDKGLSSVTRTTNDPMQTRGLPQGEVPPNRGKSVSEEFYHGTNTDFDVFKVGKQSGEGSGMFGKGVDITTNKNVANNYARSVTRSHGGKENVLSFGVKDGLKIYDFEANKSDILDFIKGQIPKEEFRYYLEAEGDSYLEYLTSDSWLSTKVADYIKSRGYDGLKYPVKYTQMGFSKEGYNYKIFEEQNVFRR